MECKTIILDTKKKKKKDLAVNCWRQIQNEIDEGEKSQLAKKSKITVNQ